MTTRLRILLAANVHDGRSGGMTRIMHFTHDRVAAAGHQVDFFWAGDAERALGRPAGRWGRFTYPVTLARHVARARARGRPYDVVNVHEPCGAALVLRRGRERVIAWSHGVERRAWQLALDERRLGREGPSAWSRVVYPATQLWQAELTLRRADHVFCLSSTDRDWLSARLGRPASHFTRVFPGAEPVYATAAADRDHARGDRLLFAGTWRKNKGIEDLVPVFAAVAARHPVTLTVLGPGFPAERVLADFPAELRARVTVAHAPDELATARAFASHDVFLLPSLFEGTPLTLVEAMTSGLPIVTTATCGMLDVIEDGRNGLLVPIRDRTRLAAAVESLVASRERRRALGAAARADAQARYTWDAVSVPVVRAYERLAARAAGAAA